MSPLPLAPAAPGAPCEECAAGCCRGFNLVLRGGDVARIARDRGLPVADFAELVWCAPQEAGSVALDPDEPGHAFRLQLRQVEEVHGPFTERCVFLRTEGGRGRCGIYESRPAMCRAYPTVWKHGALGLNAGPFCPPDSWSLAAIDGPAHAALHEEKRRLAAEDDRLVELWNGRLAAEGVRRTPEEYFTYLLQEWSA